jgi:hypothetical protein
MILNDINEVTLMLSAEDHILALINRLTDDIYTLYQSDPKSQEISSSFFRKSLNSLRDLFLPLLDHRNELVIPALKEVLLQKVPQHSETGWDEYYQQAVHKILSGWDSEADAADCPSEKSAGAGLRDPALNNAQPENPQPRVPDPSDPQPGGLPQPKAPEADARQPDDAPELQSRDAGNLPAEDKDRSLLRRIINLAYPQRPVVENYTVKGQRFDYYIPHIKLAVKYLPAVPPNPPHRDKARIYCRLSGLCCLFVTPPEFASPEKLIRKLTAAPRFKSSPE